MEYALPEKVLFLLTRLERHGEEAFAVGGCVRDLLRGAVPKDYDIATSAPPPRLLEIFADFSVVPTGIRHGTLTVMLDGEGFEITSYRADGDYSDGRHPDSVRFGTALSEDLARRDFTMNAMAYHPKIGLIDPFHGARDLRQGVIRTVGAPDRRFSEDALRILRGVRFVSRLGFSMDSATAQAALSRRDHLRQISAERIFAEFKQILTGPYVKRALLEYSAIIFTIIPELRASDGFPQRTKYHRYDVWRHIVETVAAVRPDPVMRLAMLMHDAGKPSCHTEKDGKDHFKGHPAVSAAMTEEVLTHLRCDRMAKERIVTLVRHHDERPGRDEGKILRLLHAVGEECFFQLLECQEADAAGKAEAYCREQWQEVALLRADALRLLKEGQCFRVADLALSGGDLLALGMVSGPEIGEMQRRMLEQVMDGCVENTRPALTLLVREWMLAAGDGRK